MQRRCTDRPVSRFRRVDEFRWHPPGNMGRSREPQTTDEHSTSFELRHYGKFTAKSGGCYENRVFLETYKSRSRSSTAARSLEHLPADPQPAAELPRATFWATETVLHAADTLTETALQPS
jgi:hypothetical protein